MEHGFAMVGKVGNVNAFRELALRLGPIIHETIVELRRDVDTYLTSPGRIPLHTDHPSARFIGWHCETQDPEAGETVIVDGHQVLKDLGESAQFLETVLLPCPSIASTRPEGSHPMLIPRPVRPDIYFAPWRVPIASAPSSVTDAYKKFSMAIAEPPAQAKWSIRLQPGDALFIDNRRMLHGREAISQNSPRRLYRLWLGDAPRPRLSGHGEGRKRHELPDGA